MTTRAPVANGDSLLIGCDIGTSAVKTILTSQTGQLLGHRVAEHTMRHPRPGWAENDPEDWYGGVAATVRDVLTDTSVSPERVAALAIVSQREPVVLIDHQGNALTPAISWTDRRTDAEAKEVSDRLGRAWLIENTGMAPVPGCSLTQLMWLQRHRPDEWRRTTRILFAKDYVVQRLTGQAATDVSTPGRSLLLDIERGQWLPEICDAFGIDPALLPEISHQPWEVIGELRASRARELGLLAGTPVAMGGADDAAATLGAGAIEPGELCVGTGTATNWRTVLERPRPDPTGRGDVAPHVVPQRYILEVAIESTGSSLRWLRDTIAADQSFSALAHEAGRIAPGADGLLFHPYVDGAGRAPRYLSGATGSFLGIVSGHTRGHLVRSVLEGVAYQYPPTMGIVATLADVHPPIATGDGEAQSAIWNQIKADVLGVSLDVPVIVQLAAAGAAILAGVAAGVYADVAAGVQAIVRPDRHFHPDPVRHAAYRDLRDAHERSFAFIPSSGNALEHHG
jgi:xylulokinase